MLRRFLSLCVLVILWQLSLGQTSNECSYKPPREGENWCFYTNVRFKFQGESVTQTQLPNSLVFGKGCASISDKDGNLLMYTDGITLWDKNGAKIVSTLPGDFGCSQSAIFVPNPSENGTYYIFTTCLNYTVGFVNKGLNYSTIDLTSALTNDSLQSVHLLDKTAEKISGVRHSNKHDYWVVAHGWENDVFYSYLVTNSGVDTNVVESHAGMVHTGTMASLNSVGCMKISPDGSKLALAIEGGKMVEWFDFNNSTGVVSNVRQIPSPSGEKPYGIEFSPDSKLLYFITANMSSGKNSSLYQVDMAAGSAPFLINPLPLDLTSMQLGVDGKIYIIRLKNNIMGIIENPNRIGIGCNFNENNRNLSPLKGFIGLPTFIQSYFNIPAIRYDTKCLGDDTYFNLTNTANIDSLQWDFGDPGSGASNIDDGLLPIHKFSTFGTFNVKVTEWFNNLSYVTTQPVIINKLPDKPWSPFPDSTYILPGSEYELNGSDFMKTYVWSTGEFAQRIYVSQPGYYNVTIIDTNCCMQQDTMKILLLDLFVPSAFSPNFDGLNDRFRVKGPTQGIENYNFYIYNKWGQLIWHATSFNDSWDGTLNGVECPVDVYTWVMKFGVTGNLLKRDKVVKRGVVTLLK